MRRPGRFGLGHNIRFGRRSFPTRPHITRNRYEAVVGPTVVDVESTLPVVACVEAPANRSTNVPAGCTLRSIVVVLWPTSATGGKHQALMTYRPAAENIATAIAAYWDITDPLTEEGVKMRRLSMSKCKTTLIEAAFGARITPWIFKWRGQKHMYDGDEIGIDILDSDIATTYNAQIWISFTQ